MTGRAVPRGRAPASVVVLAALAALAAGCDDAPKREARALLVAVDQYRRADDGARGDRAQAVVAVACTDASVCAAKAACLSAVSPTVRALALKDEVSARLGEMEGAHAATDGRAPPDATGLGDKLDEAERLLKEGHTNMEACEKALATLRVKYGG
ncbi:MAG: hypothetical protein ACRENE_04755 [Polyangiaceae bacterium]